MFATSPTIFKSQEERADAYVQGLLYSESKIRTHLITIFTDTNYKNIYHDGKVRASEHASLVLSKLKEISEGDSEKAPLAKKIIEVIKEECKAIAAAHTTSDTPSDFYGCRMCY